MHGEGSMRKLLDLCSRINFSLPSILTLSEHRSSHELVPILSASQLCGFEENSRPIVPREGLPLFLGSKGTINGIANDLLVGFMVVAEVSRVVGWNWLLDDLAGPDLGGSTGRDPWSAVGREREKKNLQAFR